MKSLTGCSVRFAWFRVTQYLPNSLMQPMSLRYVCPKMIVSLTVSLSYDSV